MFVLVQDASKPIASSGSEPGYVAWLSDFGVQWMQGSGVVEALVRPVAVVEAFEFVERVQQVSLVPDQGSVE
jgi:hypothetical protein